MQEHHLRIMLAVNMVLKLMLEDFQCYPAPSAILHLTKLNTVSYIIFKLQRCKILQMHSDSSMRSHKVSSATPPIRESNPYQVEVEYGTWS